MSAEQLDTHNFRREVMLTMHFGRAPKFPQPSIEKALRLVVTSPLSSAGTKFEHNLNRISWRWMSLSSPRGRDLIPEHSFRIDSRQAVSSNSWAMHSNSRQLSIYRDLNVVDNLVLKIGNSALSSG
ncbi:hypothetical protein V6Z12_D05G371600 [Gossypium hirsutum]